MNTFMKICSIIAVALLVAGGVYLLVENTSALSNLDARSGERPEFSSGERSESSEGGIARGGDERRGRGNNNEASLIEGFGQVGKVVVQVGLITVLVLGMQFIFRRVRRFRVLQTNIR